jgi:FRG domain
MKFLQTTCNWDEVKGIVRLLDCWIFRGQEKARWKLKTNIERVAENFDCRGLGIHIQEEEILHQFKRRAQHYIPSISKDMGLIDWLSLIQHHGGPTRLLDCTYSLYVASFFALENATEDAAVWCVKPKPIHRAFNPPGSLLRDMQTSSTSWQDAMNKCFVEGFTNKTGSERYPVVIVEPVRLNERMSIQKGVFLGPLSIERAFEQSLGKALDLESEYFPEFKPTEVSQDKLDAALVENSSLIKVVIKRPSHKDALTDLERMNITSATLFPGLDGYSRSLKFLMRRFDRGDDTSGVT